MKIKEYIQKEVGKVIRESNYDYCYCYANQYLLKVESNRDTLDYGEYDIKVYLPVGHIYYGKNYEEMDIIINGVPYYEKSVYAGHEVILGGYNFWELDFSKNLNIDQNYNFERALEFLEKEGCGNVELCDSPNELILCKGKLIPLQKKGIVGYTIPISIEEVLSKAKDIEKVEDIEALKRVTGLELKDMEQKVKDAEILRITTGFHRRYNDSETKNFLSLYHYVTYKIEWFERSISKYIKINSDELLFISGPITNDTNTIIDTTSIDEIINYYKEKLIDGVIYMLIDDILYFHGK